VAAAETARLIASLELQDKNFTRGIRNVERGVSRVDKKLGAFSGFVNRNVGRALDSIALRATQAIGSGLEDLATLEDATTSVTGAIAQVGKGWEVTGEQIATWANEIEADTEAAFDDKAIVASAATLIRYGKVSEDNLRPALEVMTDLAAKTGDTESAAALLGKALADPAKAAGKLARAGVVLTKSQQKQIKAMVKAGDVAGAQTLLLEILSDTTEGAAKASAGPYRDALNKLGDAGEDLRKSFAIGLLPVIQEVSEVLTTELAKPGTLNALKGIGQALADTLRSLIKSARQLPWGAIGDSLKIAGAGAKAVLDAFLGLPPWIQTAVITGWGLNKLTGGALSGIFTGLASGLIKGVLGMNAGVVNINAGVVNGGGIPGAGGKGGGLLGGFGKLLVGFTGVGLAALLASEFEDEIQGFGEELSRGWRGLVEDNFGIDIPTISPKDIEWPFGPKNTPTILPEIFGGNGILGGTAGTPPRRPVPSASKPPPGIGGLGAPETGGKRLLTGLGNLTSSIDNLEATISKPKPTPKDAGGAPGAFRPIVKAVSEQRSELNNINNAMATLKGTSAEQKTELANIKNASATLNTSITTQTAQQSAELGNIKNATATLNTTTYAGLVAATTAVTAGNLLSTFQSAAQVLAANTTTTAANNTTTAARNAGINTANAMTNAANRIVTAVNGLDLSVNVTTVNRTSTVNNRYGPSGGSSTTNRSGELE
jgi:hypothetical protein